MAQNLALAPGLPVAPRNEDQYVLDTDASEAALGAVLQQQQDGQLRVIGYVSRALLPAEGRYCISRAKNFSAWFTV